MPKAVFSAPAVLWGTLEVSLVQAAPRHIIRISGGRAQASEEEGGRRNCLEQLQVGDSAHPQRDPGQLYMPPGDAGRAGEGGGECLKQAQCRKNCLS